MRQTLEDLVWQITSRADSLQQTRASLVALGAVFPPDQQPGLSAQQIGDVDTAELRTDPRLWAAYERGWREHARAAPANPPNPGDSRPTAGPERHPTRVKRKAAAKPSAKPANRPTSAQRPANRPTSAQRPANRPTSAQRPASRPIDTPRPVNRPTSARRPANRPTNAQRQLVPAASTKPASKNPSATVPGKDTAIAGDGGPPCPPPSAVPHEPMEVGDDDILADIEALYRE